MVLVGDDPDSERLAGFMNRKQQRLPKWQPRVINRNGRDDWIRTSDLTHPKRARYQAAPRPVSLT